MEGINKNTTNINSVNEDNNITSTDSVTSNSYNYTNNLSETTKISSSQTLGSSVSVILNNKDKYKEDYVKSKSNRRLSSFVPVKNKNSNLRPNKSNVILIEDDDSNADNNNNKYDYESEFYNSSDNDLDKNDEDDETSSYISEPEEMLTTVNKTSINTINSINIDMNNSINNISISNINNVNKCNDSMMSTQTNNSFYYIEKYEKILKENIKEYTIDMIFNNEKNKDDYLLNNLKVIKSMNYAFSQDNYCDKLLYIKEKFIKTSEKTTLNKSMPLILLDLDETMIRSEIITEKYDQNEENKEILELKNYDKVYLSLNHDNITYTQIGLYVNPDLEMLLDYLQENKFNIGLFTAGTESYADEILNILEIDKYFSVKLYRDSCINIQDFYIKDLSFITEILDVAVLLIDNNIYSFANNISEGLLIYSFYGDKNYNEFQRIIDYFNNNLSSFYNITNSEIININSNNFHYNDLLYEL